MYTIEEIIQFFKTKKIKRHFPKSNELNNNERNRENRNNIKYKSVNDKRIHNHNNNNYNYSQNINLNKFLGNSNKLDWNLISEEDKLKGKETWKMIMKKVRKKKMKKIIKIN